MKKHPLKITTGPRGLPPGVYIVTLDDGMAPMSQLEVEAFEGAWLIQKAEKAAAAEGGEGGESSTGGISVTNAVEKIGPVIASLAQRFL